MGDVARAWSDADSVRDALAEGASNREQVRRRATALRIAAKALDELAALRVERAHLGVDLLGERVDRDEQRHLTPAQRVEDLPVVTAGPDPVAVGDKPEPGDVVT